jgi:arylsulfatase A
VESAVAWAISTATAKTRAVRVSGTMCSAAPTVDAHARFPAGLRGVQLFGFAAALFLASVPGPAAEPPPNFVVILADDLGYGDVGAYGATLIATPHLDRLAREGVRLTGFYSSANVCTAARGGLLTGRYPIRLGLAGDVARPTNDVALPDAETTIAEALGPLGYRTALIGKWHLGSHLRHSPLRHGFDEFYGLLHSNDMLPLALYRGEEAIEEPVDQSTLTERYTAEAIAFLERNRDRPFFLYLPHTFPHVPLHVSERFAGTSRAGLYGDTVEAIDWSTGEILKALRELGLDERTLVIFTSDNGPWWEGSSGVHRERKGTAWEGGLRVPFLARWPGQLPADSVSAEPAINLDLFPTLVRLAGGEVPSARPVDGRDLMPLLRGQGSSPHDAIFLFDADRIAAVRSGRFKLVVESKYVTVLARIGHPDYYHHPGLLFDLELDPSESYSFTREQPEVAARLARLLEDGQRELGARVPATVWTRPGSP